MGLNYGSLAWSHTLKQKSVFCSKLKKSCIVFLCVPILPQFPKGSHWSVGSNLHSINACCRNRRHEHRSSCLCLYSIDILKADKILPALCAPEPVRIRGIAPDFDADEADDEVWVAEVLPSLISMVRKAFMLDWGSPWTSCVSEDAVPLGVSSSSELHEALLTFSVVLCGPPTARCDWSRFTPLSGEVDSEREGWDEEMSWELSLSSEWAGAGSDAPTVLADEFPLWMLLCTLLFSVATAAGSVNLRTRSRTELAWHSDA